MPCSIRKAGKMESQEFDWGSKLDVTPVDEEIVFRCLNCEYVIRPYRNKRLLKKWNSIAIANHWDSTGHSYCAGYEPQDMTKRAEEPRSHYFIEKVN